MGLPNTYTGAVPAAGDGAIVVWSNHGRVFTPPATAQRVEGQRFSAGGERLWGLSGKVLREASFAGSNWYTYLELQAVPDGAGGVVFAAEDWNGEEPASRDVVVQRVSADGALLWPPDTYIGATTEIEQVDSLTAMPDGGVVVGVARSDGLTTYLAYLQRLDGNGASVWPQLTPVGVSPSMQDYATFGLVVGDRLRFVYSTFGPTSYDLHLAEFALDLPIRLAVARRAARSCSTSWRASSTCVKPVSSTRSSASTSRRLTR